MPERSKIKAFQKTRYVILFSTFSKRKDAEKVAEGLIAKRLAACCNLIPGLTSLFTWKGKKERCSETLLMIKTTSHRLQSACRFLQAHHPYEIPEIVAMPIIAGEVGYLKWIESSCR